MKTDNLNKLLGIIIIILLIANILTLCSCKKSNNKPIITEYNLKITIWQQDTLNQVLKQPVTDATITLIYNNDSITKYVNAGNTTFEFNNLKCDYYNIKCIGKMSKSNSSIIKKQYYLDKDIIDTVYVKY